MAKTIAPEIRRAWDEDGAFAGAPQVKACSAADLKAMSDELDAFVAMLKARDAEQVRS